MICVILEIELVLYWTLCDGNFNLLEVSLIKMECLISLALQIKNCMNQQILLPSILKNKLHPCRKHTGREIMILIIGIILSAKKLQI